MDQTDRNFIDEMTKMIIRPHRDIYAIQKLGPPQMIIKGRVTSQDRPSFKYVQITRKDHQIDCKGKKIHLSYFGPAETEHIKTHHTQQTEKSKKCVVYLHANSGSRVEGLDLVKYILPFGWNMAIFDYRGSGISQGQYTSMGVNQSQDLEQILHHLNAQERISDFCLWGRSMGAVTILYYLTKQYSGNHSNLGINIRGVVLDSPFSNMLKLMYEIGSNKINLPQFVFTPIINSITERLTLKLGFNLIKELDLIQRIKQLKQKNKDTYKLVSKIDALFITSLEDKLVNSSHVQLLHQNFPFHINQIHYFNGQHNQNRSETLKNKCAQFLCQIPERKKDITSLKRPDLDLKKVIQQPNKQLHFLQGRQTNSPKWRPLKERVVTQNSGMSSKQSRLSFGRSQTQNQTIIINNNYNVSVSVFDGGRASFIQSKKPNHFDIGKQNHFGGQKLPNQISQQMIPPINFRGDQLQGHMTDRLNDNHTFHKYHVPQTAKVEKKQHSSFTINPFNPSSPTSSANYNPFQKQETKKNVMNERVVQKKTSVQFKGQQIDIPRIKLEGLQHSIDETNQRKSNRGLFDQVKQKNQHKLDPLGAPPQLHIVMHSSQPVSNLECSEKGKLSLSQLRKFQKQQHERCVMKSSKVISIKDKRQYQDFQRLHLKSQNNILKVEKLQESCIVKQRSQPTIQRLGSTGSKDVRSLKTSLMQKKKAERKNSETSQGMKNIYMKHFNKRPDDKEKETITSPLKTLEFKYKIEHL